MVIKGDVLNASAENRELVGKDGVKKLAHVSHVLLVCETPTGKEVINLRSYDESFVLPKVGDKFTTPPVKKYECFSGACAEVMC